MPLGQARATPRRRPAPRGRRAGGRAAGRAREPRGAAYDLHGQPSAQSVGARLAGARGLSDLLLERNQAFRTALLDLQHVTTLLGYAAVLARTRGDAELAEWHDGWEARLRALESARTRRGGCAGGRSGGGDRPRRREPARPRRRSRWCRIRDRGRGDRPFTTRRSGPTPRNLKEFCSMSVDVVVAVPVFMDMTFVVWKGLPGSARSVSRAISCARPAAARSPRSAPRGSGFRRRSPPHSARTRRATCSRRCSRPRASSSPAPAARARRSRS